MSRTRPRVASIVDPVGTTVGVRKSRTKRCSPRPFTSTIPRTASTITVRASFGVAAAIAEATDQVEVKRQAVAKTQTVLPRRTLSALFPLEQWAARLPAWSRAEGIRVFTMLSRGVAATAKRSLDDRTDQA
jgi:hypothetical protein